MTTLLLLPLKMILIILDWLVTLITFVWLKPLLMAMFCKPIFRKNVMRSVPVNGDESHRVATNFKDNLITLPSSGIETLYDVAKYAFDTYPDSVCMEKRDFIRWKVPNKVKEFGPNSIKYTYQQVGCMSYKFGAALRGEMGGIVPAPSTTTLKKIEIPCRIAIFENTCIEWLIAALGATTQSITIVTVYATLGLDAVVDAINDNMCGVIVCNKSNVMKLYKQHKDGLMPTLTTIIYTNDLVSKECDYELPKLDGGGKDNNKKGGSLKVISFDDFIQVGDTTKYPPTPPTSQTTSTIMYTSGSTGKPKGVVITHASIVGGIAASQIVLKILPNTNERYLAYLPCAHIMEYMLEFIVLYVGGTLCYSDPKSLSSNGSYPMGSIQYYRPTRMVAVPKIWDTIKKGIETKIESLPLIKKTIIQTAISWKLFNKSSRYGLLVDTPLFNILVFNKLRKEIGFDNMRWGLTGGGPTNGEVQTYIREVLGFPLVQGYGLTETCAGLTVQAIDDTRVEVQGVPIPTVEVKLVSTPEFNDSKGKPYLSTDRTDVDGITKIYGRGEIFVRGVNVTSGYYNMEDDGSDGGIITDDDGWYATGDIGEFLAQDGSLKVVDRKKNLVKLKGGEYVALEKMEMIYGNSNFINSINGGICCYGDADMDRPVAILQLNVAYTLNWAKTQVGFKVLFGTNNKHEGRRGGESLDNDNDSSKMDVLMKHHKDIINKVVLESLWDEHKKSDLSHLEKVVGVQILWKHDTIWTPHNDCLTAANKLQRRGVITMFERELNETKQLGIF